MANEAASPSDPSSSEALEAVDKPVFYFENGNGKLILVYCIPRDWLCRLVKQGGVKKDVLDDYPDGVDIPCFESEFDDFEENYGFRPPFDPKVVTEIFSGRLSRSGEVKRAGFVNAGELNEMVKGAKKSPSIKPLMLNPKALTRQAILRMVCAQLDDLTGGIAGPIAASVDLFSNSGLGLKKEEAPQLAGILSKAFVGISGLPKIRINPGDVRKASKVQGLADLVFQQIPAGARPAGGVDPEMAPTLNQRRERTIDRVKKAEGLRRSLGRIQLKEAKLFNDVELEKGLPSSDVFVRLHQKSKGKRND